MEKDILDGVIKAEKTIQKKIDIAKYESQEEIKIVKKSLKKKSEKKEID